MLSVAYITDVSKSKHCGPNQTAPDLDPLFFALHIQISQLCQLIFAAVNNKSNNLALLSDPETQIFFLSSFNP